jgi:signal transduction histidine kinase
VSESRVFLLHDLRPFAVRHPKSVLSLNTDVTERKKFEAQMLRVQRMEGIGTLAEGMAHDLNNMLLPILMSADLLKERLQDPGDHDLAETIQAECISCGSLKQTKPAIGDTKILLLHPGEQPTKKPQEPPIMLPAQTRAVFISYAHADNENKNPKERGWIR